ncbi:hypothetical protein JAAARDRAFT_36724 [Jaapia argillacea MUCL 33604]|uniref:Membrane insertase YidC/Oxa/ALB C-terminal domain-containing protein n=1 Tax=Jaapia argillacea MUCL 33604 TaxID=933084 RepID=A0A067Q041_9AGAM|nr:hypothetical protein JAAARDRAFT_36724 [Jaapia argillacea MUCL 33604]
MASSLCAGRMGQMGTRIAPRLHPKYGGRLLSTFVHPRNPVRTHLLHRTVPTLVGPSLLAQRNYWWSSKTPTPAASSPSPDSVVPPEPLQTQEPSESTAAAGDSASSSDLSLDQVGVVDAASSAEPILSDIQAIPPFDELAANAIVPVGVPPLQLGDLANLGIAGWSPIGLSAWLLEIINVYTGLPWWQTIVAGTVVSRAIIFPFIVSSTRNTAALIPYQDRMAAVQADMKKAQASRSQLAMQKVMLQQKQIYQDAGVSVTGSLIVPFVQLPISLGMFFAVKRLCESQLVQLQTGGLEGFGGIFQDLTVPDPYYIMPALALLLMNVQLSLSARDMTTNGREGIRHAVNAMRLMTCVFLPFAANLPSGTMLYVTTGIVCVAVQTVVLRIPAVRRALGILPLGPPAKVPTMMDSYRFMKDWYKEEQLNARRAQHEAQRRR